MKAFVITLKSNAVSEKGYKNLVKSSQQVCNDFPIERYDAVTAEKVEQLIKQLDIQWTWPHTGSVRDEKTGIQKIGYGGKDHRRRKACGISHYLLWKTCAEKQQPLLILEHDALFIKKLDVNFLLESSFQVIGLNDPFGATRLPAKFDRVVKQSKEEILPVPVIDKPQIAQGIAGNSAYVIKPKAAETLISLVKEHGMWNNDAIMCRQLMPDMIGVTRTYYTRVQGLQSTTSS